MLLLTGVPGSGKTSHCLDQVRKHLRDGDTDWRLIVPTATLAEHLRNQLTREGYVFPPGNIGTLAKLVAELTRELTTVSEAALDLITAEVLSQDCPRRFAPVAEFPGFRRALSGAIEEFTSAGGSLSDLTAQAADFGAVLHAVLPVIRSRGFVLQADRVRQAADSLGSEPIARTVWLAGFYSFNNPELGFVRALAKRTQLTVSVADWAGAAPAIQALAADAAEHRRLGDAPAPASASLFTASTVDGELAEIARRILLENKAGRAWRDIGIILRTEDPYVPALRDTLDRFGIPARFYFGEPLSDHPVVRYLSAVVQALLSGWDFEHTLIALRSSGSPLEHDDGFDAAVRKHLPGSGLPNLRDLLPEASRRSIFAELEKLSPWVTQSLPPSEWQARFSSLTSLYFVSPVRDRVTHTHVNLVRSNAAALGAWADAVSATTCALGAASVTCRQFWNGLQAVLASASLRPPDHRRDVVHVLDTFEARQWRLPIVFICGLVEKQFPKHHSEDPILGDDLRRRFQIAGIPLRTSAERQADERFLFETALSRATGSVTLSYPLLNAKADANLPSFFLGAASEYFGRSLPKEAAVEVRPIPLRRRAPEPRPHISDDHLRSELLRMHATIRATSIESFLQCPFQFFTGSTLGLESLPEQPWDRLNVMVQGNIAHAVLERAFRRRRPVRDAFDAVFTEFCTNERIPDGYRTEAVRLELLHNLEMFATDPRLVHGVQSLFEQDVDVPIDEFTRVKGRIDRLEVDAHGRATVIDYKYQSPAGLKRTSSGHDERTRVQGGLYLLALPQLGSYQPAGMVYCGFKREVTFGGWIIEPHFLELKQGCSQTRLQEVMQTARELTINAVQEIRQGRIAPKPADENRCSYCSSASICRVETMTAEIAETAGGAAAL